MKSIRQISDVISLDMLQYLQDNFSKAMGLAFITVDYKGRQITKTSGYTTFCSTGQQNTEFKELCAQCDAHGGLHAAITGQPNIYYCHADLVDFAVPLILEGSYIGAVLGGQAKLPEKEADRLDHIMSRRTNWRQDTELCQYHDDVVTLPYEKIEAAVTLLRDMIQNLIEEEYKNMLSRELAEKSKELLEEKAYRLDLQERLEETELEALDSQIGFESFFTSLNIISKQAYQEKAHKTEELVCDFSAMIRYSLSKRRIVTISEEIDYTERWLSIQKTQLAGKLNYSIALPEEYANTPCPFMILRPIIENALKHAIVNNSLSCGEIHIEARQDDTDLLLTVKDNGEGMTQTAIENILRPLSRREGGAEKMSLTNTHQKLISYFGEGYGLCIKSLEDGISGTEVSLRLPLSGKGLAR